MLGIAGAVPSEHVVSPDIEEGRGEEESLFSSYDLPSSDILCAFGDRQITKSDCFRGGINVVGSMIGSIGLAETVGASFFKLSQETVFIGLGVFWALCALARLFIFFCQAKP